MMKKITLLSLLIIASITAMAEVNPSPTPMKAEINDNVVTLSYDEIGKPLKEALNSVVNAQNREQITRINIIPLESGDKIIPENDLSNLFSDADYEAGDYYRALHTIDGL